MTIDQPRLTPAELDAETATLLPDKQVISLLNLDVDLDVALDLAAPIDLAVAANANVAAPINASVSANIGTIGSQSVAVAEQTAVITQSMQDVTASAVAAQTAEIVQ